MPSTPAATPNPIAYTTTIEEGLDFILSYFPEPVWPRTISTKTTEGKQILVFNRKEALARFRQANFLDCRLNAYPNYTEYMGINRQAPNFIMVDFDLEYFKSKEALDKSLKNTIRKIKEIFVGVEAEPTVIWTGNGYHIYQPIDSFVLEQEEVFNKFNQPSREFLRFAEWYLSKGKSDPAHNAIISFKNCMLRIPGSHNSNCLKESKDSEVKIIQRWNSYRPRINLLLGSFYVYLIDRRIKQLLQQKKKLEKGWHEHNATTEPSQSSAAGANTTIPWIEKLLQTPMQDHRKFSVWRILSPYLMNMKKISYNDAIYIIKGWLDKSSNLRRLDFRPDYYISYNLKMASRKGYFPITANRLKDENKRLYDILRMP